LIGKPAPAFSEIEWNPALPQSNGKYVLIHFGAPWSVASMKAEASVRNLQKKLTEKLLLLIVVSGSASNASPSSAENGNPQFLDADSKLATRFDVTAVPTAILIDPQGVVVYKGHPAALDDATMSKLLVK
jgi:thiol-disulfide isomerase/thioredoxin